MDTEDILWTGASIILVVAIAFFVLKGFSGGGSASNIRGATQKEINAIEAVEGARDRSW